MDELIFVDQDVPYQHGPVIKVVGVGGAGGNALNNMINAGIKGVGYIAVNTDSQALDQSLAQTKVLLGKTGLGAGGRPEVARMFAIDSIEEIRAVLKDADLIFITCGMGGGTGTGAAPVIAAEAKSAGALTVAVVSTPPVYQGRRRNEIAQNGLNELVQYVDSYVIVPNDALQDAGHKLTYDEALRMADDILRQSIQGISEMTAKAGHINIDFADMRTAMSERGKSVMGIGVATGDNRAKQAFENALRSPLLSDTSIKGAHAVLLNIVGNKMDLMMDEIGEIQSCVHEQAGDDTFVVDGIGYDDRTDGSISVTIVATGIKARTEKVMKLDNVKSAKPETAAVADRVKGIIKDDQRLSGIDDVNEEMFEVPTYLRKQAD